MNFPRSSGILLHPTSLPGDFGIGDLGPEAFHFVDLLANTGQSYWQVLPLGPTGYGDSPYQGFSAFAGNTLLISPEKLVDDGLVTAEDIAVRRQMSAEKVDFGAVIQWKASLLEKAYKTFRNGHRDDLDGAFQAFCSEKRSWLDDYAFYRAIKKQHGQKPWFAWPDELKKRHDDALRTTSEQLSDEIRAEKFFQFLFFRQWLAIRKYTNEKGVKIIGDIPIFVALDSADVWCNQGKFKLNDDGTPKVVSGVPPDFFSKTGQLWGNPIYDWDHLREDGFRWWITRFRATLDMVDIIRLDHFRGFDAAWEVPGDDKTAEHGNWVSVPGKELFGAVKAELGDLPMIVEDLGFMTAEAEQLRDSFSFPGMRILQFAFGGDARNHDLPHNYVRNCVAYTGTHDNETTVGWFAAQADPTHSEINSVREHCLRYLDSNGTEIHWNFIRAVWASIADIAIVPMQDILGLGNDARMNLPGTTSGNWQWRMVKDSITEEIASRLKHLSEIYGRNK